MPMTVIALKGWVPDPSTDFGARLALIRQHRGWNMKEAAQTCGIDAGTWRGWESGTSKPRDYTAACTRIAATSGADYIWLATGQVPGNSEAAPGPKTGSRPSVAGARFELATSGLRARPARTATIIPFPAAPQTPRRAA